MNKLCHSYSQLCQGERSETRQTPACLRNLAGSFLRTLFDLPSSPVISVMEGIASAGLGGGKPEGGPALCRQGADLCLLFFCRIDTDEDFTF